MFHGKRVHTYKLFHDTDQRGNPLCMVIFADRTYENVPHTEFEGIAP